MPLRFFHRFRAGPFRLNLSKRGVSYSVGGKGAWFTAGRNGLRTTVGLPGSGIYWTQQRAVKQPPSIAATPPANDAGTPWSDGTLGRALWATAIFAGVALGILGVLVHY